MKTIILLTIILIGLNIDIYSQCSCLILRSSNQIIFGRNHDYYNPQYTTVFDITNLKLYFRTNLNSTIREINFKVLEDNCSTKAKLLNIQTLSEGIVNKSFVDYSIQENAKYIYKFYEKEERKMPMEEMEFMSFYPEMFQCEK